MKRAWMLTLITAAMAATPLLAQTPDDDDTIPSLRQHRLDGPRLGMTYVTGPRAEQRLKERNLEPLMSLLGWHFEQLIRPQRGGPMFVFQEVLLVAGVDQNTAIPSASLVMGIRLPSGFEFGMGPNVSPVGTALAMGVGKSLRYGGVTIPINLTLVRSRGALRTGFLVGYAVHRR